MTTHPTISVFGNTISATFPLILVIGREPNTALPIAPGIGAYDFRWSPGCAFWNISYGTVARVLDPGMTTWQLKQLCIHKGGSPIVYADALPIGLPVHVTNKDKHRAEVIARTDLLQAHISDIFSHNALTPRVQIVLASGLYSPTFNEPVALLTNEAGHHGIPVVQVPFFYGTNASKIQSALDTKARDIIAGVMRDFRESAPSRVFKDEVLQK